MVSTDDDGAPAPPPCAHCGAALEPGRITCPACGEARSLGLADGPPASAPPAVPAPAAPAPEPDPDPDPDPDPEAEAAAFELGDPFREPARRRPREPAERSRTGLLVGGLIGLVLVVLVAAAALWALGQNGGSGY